MTKHPDWLTSELTAAADNAAGVRANVCVPSPERILAAARLAQEATRLVNRLLREQVAETKRRERKIRQEKGRP